MVEDGITLLNGPLGSGKLVSLSALVVLLNMKILVALAFAHAFLQVRCDITEIIRRESLNGVSLANC